MAISIGDALLSMGVDTKDLDKGMKGIGATIKKHQKAIGLGMTAAGGAILAAGALSVKAFAEMGDEVAKMARKTGFTTETLSELRHAAELSGTSLSGLEKATKRMSSAIEDAKDGLAETKRSFDKLGITVEDLEGLSPEEAFLKLGEAIAEIEDPILRAAIAQDIFGRAGMDLIPMFDEGTEALEKMRREAHDLGIVFDQEAAKKAENYTDAMHRMGEATSGVKMAIAEHLIPVLMPLIDNITTIIKKITAWAKEHPTLTKVIAIGAMGFAGLLTVLGLLLVMMPGLIAVTAAFGITLSAAIWPITLIAIGIAGLIAVGVLLWKNWDTISAKTKEIWGGISKFFKKVWVEITGFFKEHWDKILAILFPAVGIPILIARNWAPIKDAILKPIRAAAQGVEDAINWIIRSLNRLKFDIPDWIPGIGGNKFGLNIPEVNLAKFGRGGLITEPTLLYGMKSMRPYAVAGERGTEVVSPAGGVTNNFKISQLVVRDESDVRRIAEELYTLQHHAMRMAGA